MTHLIISFVVSLFCFQHLYTVQRSPNEVFVGSREGDPESIVENVSTIHGDYSESEVDLTVTAPDSLILSRFYTSQDSLQTTSFGGWRFLPHCFLSIRHESKKKSFTTAEGTFEKKSVTVGTPEGSLLTYVGWVNSAHPAKNIVFKIDAENETVGLANTARGIISCWTNLKNNELSFDQEKDSFELSLASEGRRIYVKRPGFDQYFLSYEILPSGNKIFYEWNENGQVNSIKETNASEKKVLAWIRLRYGDEVHVETSDGKTVEYHFQKDSSGASLLTEVKRSHKPNLSYRYQVVDNQSLLLKKELPEGRFIHVDYYMKGDNRYKVRSVTTPDGVGATVSTQFSYSAKSTEVLGPGARKARYCFNEEGQLVKIEQYLQGALYRVHKKVWGKKKDAGNLLSTAVEDGQGTLFSYKTFSYDAGNKGNIVEEREYGNLTGSLSKSLTIEKNGRVNADCCTKTYYYFSENDSYGFFQYNSEGTGTKYWYKKGSNLLVKKFIIKCNLPEASKQRTGIEKRYFYEYNGDAVLVRLVVDDGSGKEVQDDSRVNEKLITVISPKQELPNVGAPAIVEQKYSKGKIDVLLTRTVNGFDSQGNITLQSIYDANGEYRYSISRKYSQGLLISETDPLGNETLYSYDQNQNRLSENRIASGLSFEYGYDLRNRLVSTIEKDTEGHTLETKRTYDSTGKRLSERDRYGNETLYVYDDFHRVLSITYPEACDGYHTASKQTYTYTYDLFDNQTSVMDPSGAVLLKAYTVTGKPSEVRYLDGTRESFLYDTGGNLLCYVGRDGISQRFDYEYLGRISRVRWYSRDNSDSPRVFKEE